MIQIEKTARFDEWLARLRDRDAAAIVDSRLFRLHRGLFGDMKYIGSGVSELRIHHGPGYRIYITFRGAELVLLICGGVKATQASDIKLAKALAANLSQLS